MKMEEFLHQLRSRVVELEKVNNINKSATKANEEDFTILTPKEGCKHT